MLLFIVLAITVLVFALLALLLVGTTAAVFVMIFGDLIVCMMLIVWIFKKIFNKKNNYKNKRK